MNRRVSNLVAPLSAFVGREVELAALEATFAEGARLVTIVGPPGMGKTRLLLRFAETRGAGFSAEGGVWLCDLTEAKSRSDVCRGLAAALGVRLPAELDGEALVDAIVNVIRERGKVLILCDNFEQLDREADELLESWCCRAPDVHLLVTSRRKLGVSSEVVFELEPLATSDAARLFVERARSAGESARDDDATVTELVRALDGIPLAIELAAARSNVLSARELLARLASSHRVLSGPADQERSGGLRSLEDAVRRSWDFLALPEQRALAQCAFFGGDFSLAAAEAIVDLGNDGSEGVIDVLAALREKSLIAHRRVGDETRFRMYASLRDFARERLTRQFDLASVAARHRRYYVDYAFALADEFWRSGDAALLRKLEAERANILLVFRGLGQTSTAEDDRDLARIVFAFEPVLTIASGETEVVDVLGAGIAAAERIGERKLAARLLVSRGDAHGIRGDNPRALADLDAAVALASAIEDDAIAAEALMLRSVRLRQGGKVEDALALAMQASTLAGEGDWPHVEGACALVTGMLLGELGRSTESRRSNMRARAIFAEAGDRWSEALALANIAQLDQAAGDEGAARQGFDAANATFESFGDRRYEARYRAYSAALDHEFGRLAAAKGGYLRALDLMRGLRLTHTEAWCRACFGALLATCNEIAEARAEFDRAEAIIQRVEAPMFRAALDLHRGHLSLAEARTARTAADRERAASLIAAARDRCARALHRESSEDVRFAARLLERAITTLDERGDHASVVLTVSLGARVFRIGDAAPVDLSRRGSLHRILDWLVDQHEQAPNRASDWQVLLERGWPGERVLTEAGATRVRVAIATLRKLGLAQVLETRDDGYLLGARARVVRRADL